MAEQLRGPFEKFLDWRQCAAVMLFYLPLHNSGALLPVHELFNRPSYLNNSLVTDSNETAVYRHLKGKVVPVLFFSTENHARGVLREWRYSFIHSLSSAPGGVHIPKLVSHPRCLGRDTESVQMKCSV
jgi:hypothetical protein